jgi:30S ribosomal protein S31
MMGKGDKRSRRGKIYRGSYGRTRPKPSKKRRAKKLTKS